MLNLINSLFFISPLERIAKDHNFDLIKVTHDYYIAVSADGEILATSKSPNDCISKVIFKQYSN